MSRPYICPIHGTALVQLPRDLTGLLWQCTAPACSVLYQAPKDATPGPKAATPTAQAETPPAQAETVSNPIPS